MDSQFFKEVILPISQISSTLLVGGILAYYLNRRTNKDRVKGLLIDSYLEYIQLYQKYKFYHESQFQKKVYKLLINSTHYATFQDLKIELEKKLSKLEADSSYLKNEKEINLLVSIYKFSFLLGIKKSSRLLKNIEQNQVYKLLKETDLQNLLIDKIFSEVIRDQKVINSRTISKHKEHLDSIDQKIIELLSKYVFEIFETFNIELAAEIATH